MVIFMGLQYLISKLQWNKKVFESKYLLTIFQTIPNSSTCKEKKGASIIAEQVEKNQPEMVLHTTENVLLAF